MTDALALADALESRTDGYIYHPEKDVNEDAAAALRELHAENERLTARITAADTLLAHIRAEYIPSDSGWPEIIAGDLHRALHSEEDTDGA